ncbi:MAG TPA: S16 family serine protease, partial [Ktedonobacterales bacterium]
MNRMNKAIPQYFLVIDWSGDDQEYVVILPEWADRYAIDHGAILRFEMQVAKGRGRIVPLGSIQRVMVESIEAAAQYVKVKAKDLGINADWHEHFDVAVLATYVGIQGRPISRCDHHNWHRLGIEESASAERHRHDGGNHHHEEGAASGRY